MRNESFYTPQAVGLLKAFTILIAISIANDVSAGEDMPATEPAIFVKVMLPEDGADHARTGGTDQAANQAAKQLSPDDLCVEQWIRQTLKKQRQTQLRAMTQWVRLPPGELDSTPVWDATVDGRHWGCPVGGAHQILPNGRCQVELTGWTPVGAQLRGNVIPMEPGCRTIAKVGFEHGSPDDGGASQFELLAYVAIIVAPVGETASID